MPFCPRSRGDHDETGPGALLPGLLPRRQAGVVMPVCLARVIGTLTRNDGLKFASRLMAYFDKVGELGDPTEANQILGAPTTTLDIWLERRKALR